MGSVAVKKLEGFSAIGGEMPWIRPYDIKIVGVDIDQSSENWYAFCPRAGDKLEEEWINDIRIHGVRMPVDVYRDHDTCVMLEGRRRVTAARLIWDEQTKAGVPEADRITVRVNIRRGTPMELFVFNVGSENRKERTPMQRASLMLQAQKYGADNAAVAKMFGCTSATVKNMLSLFDLSSNVQKAVDTGEFPLREAIKLADKPRDEQNTILADLRENGAMRGEKASNGIEAAKRGKKVAEADTKRMRSKVLLEKWRTAVKKSEKPIKVDLNDVLKFVLGGPIPPDVPASFRETLEAAGFKGKK